MTGPGLIAGLTDPHEIGCGGFGTVYRMRQTALHRDVAVKVLQAAGGLDPRADERFRREVQALGSLSGHPHIVGVHEAGFTAAGQPFLVMPLMTGGQLGDRLRDGGALDIEAALDLGVKMCGAVATAHEAGLLHRDIKPDNVLYDAFDEPLLADFGIAALVGATATATGDITASLSYAAPEVLDGVRADARADVYSLSATIFACLQGRAPFDQTTDSSAMALIARILTAPVPDLRRIGVPGRVAEVLELGLARDRNDRLATVAGLGEMLADAQQQLGYGVTPLRVMAATRDSRTAFRTQHPAQEGPVATERPGIERMAQRSAPRPSPAEVDSDDVMDARAADGPSAPAVPEGTTIRAVPALPPPVPGANDPDAPPLARRRRTGVVVLVGIALVAVAAAAGTITYLQLPRADVDEVALSSGSGPFARRISDRASLIPPTGASDLLTEAHAMGSWWALADWCTAAGEDREGGCYDLAADYLEPAVGQDPRMITLVGDADRASVLGAVDQGYAAGVAALDLTRDPDGGEHVVTRPGNGLLCDPDCQSIEEDLADAGRPAEATGSDAEASEEPEESEEANASPTDEDDPDTDDPGEEEDPEEASEEPLLDARPAPAPPPPPPVAPPAPPGGTPGCPFDTSTVIGFESFPAAEQRVLAPVVQWASSHNAHIFEGRDTIDCAWTTLSSRYRSVHNLERQEWGRTQSTTWFASYRVDGYTPSGDGVVVDLTFVSGQDPSLGYQGQSCTEFSLQYLLRPSGSTWQFEEKILNHYIRESFAC